MPNDGDIRAYWDGKAKALSTDPSATMKDVMLRQLEIEAICARLKRDDLLLDVGCGNAYGSIAFAQVCRAVIAVDYSHGMIESARTLIAQSSRPNVEARIGSVMEVGHDFAEKFSAVTSVRCLINLDDFAQQGEAIDSICDAIEPCGRLFLIEGVRERFDNMNKMRVDVGLEPIPLNWHNHLFVEDELVSYLNKRFRITETVDFGEYYFMSRIFHPLAVFPESPKFESHLNVVAANIWRSKAASHRLKDISTLVMYVCEKKGR